MATQAGRNGSVVVVTYKRPTHLRTCLEHLSRQTEPPRETIVVDASPDRESEDVVGSFPGVKYFRNELGLGYMATSRAIGLSHVTADVVAFIDDDAYAEPAWLEELLKRYTDPTVGAVGGRARNAQPGEEAEGLDQIGRLMADGTLTGFFAADPGHDVDVDHLIGCNMSMRRDVLLALGGIRDRYPGTSLREDADTTLRIRQAGYRVVYTPDAVVLHVGGTYSKGRRFDTRYQYFAARNHVVLLASALGPKDSRTRRYGRTVAVQTASELWSALAAPFSSERQTVRAKLRGVGGGFLRAGTLVAGSIAGTVAAARLLNRE